MKTKKTELLRILRSLKTDEIKRSFENPNRFMSKTNLTLHKIVLRQRGEL